MTGRILVVDDILANLVLLEARLSAEYFDVVTAESGAQALSLLERERIDVVLLDVMMPGLDGFEVCRRIKASPATQHIPVVMVTALDKPDDKLEGLDAGADDFLTKPVDDIALVTRVKNLARLKTLDDEMAMRVASGANLGAMPAAELDQQRTNKSGRILVVEDDAQSARHIFGALTSEHTVAVEPDLARAFARVGAGEYDLLIVSIGLATGDGLRLCSQVRALAHTRHLPIIILVQPGEEARLLRGLDMGVNDYLNRPVDRSELVARVRTQLKRKRYADKLRCALDESLELAITDPLTGLNNRRYMETHLGSLLARAHATGDPLSLLVADIDYFKSVNDTRGHDAGDAVLREIAQRLRRDTREADLACRLGGEEFIVIMPNTLPETAVVIGERLRESVASLPFRMPDGSSLSVTLSVGIATRQPDDSIASLMKRADLALYDAKHRGRNRVVSAAA